MEGFGGFKDKRLLLGHTGVVLFHFVCREKQDGDFKFDGQVHVCFPSEASAVISSADIDDYLGSDIGQNERKLSVRVSRSRGEMFK